MGGGEEPYPHCRCRRDTPTSHPCHWGAYSCENEGEERFYPAGGAWLGGVFGRQIVQAMHQTWACGEHWDTYRR